MLAAHSHESCSMNSERNVRPSGCALSAWRIWILSGADPRNDRLQGGDEREHDLAPRDHLTLVGASLRAGPEPSEQFTSRLAAGIAVPLEERREALLTKAAGID